MLTLQDLKDKIEEIESQLKEDQTLDDIPLQHDITNSYSSIDIEIYNYMGFYYASIDID